MRKHITVILPLCILLVAAAGIAWKCYTAEPAPTPYVIFQDRCSLDWDAQENAMLLQLATYKGGTVEDRPHTILVALNRVWDEHYPNSICEVVEAEMPDDVWYATIDEESLEAMDLIRYERFDNSEGALTYE